MFERGEDVRRRHNISRDVLNAVNKKAKKKVTPKEIQKLASGVKPSTVKDDDQLRRLIKQVAKMANISVSETTINDIVKAVKGSGLNPKQMEQMMKMMMRK